MTEHPRTKGLRTQDLGLSVRAPLSPQHSVLGPSSAPLSPEHSVLSPSSAPTFRIVGGSRLRGEVRVGGAKNAALPIMAAALLTRDVCVIHNVPRIEDITTLSDLLRSLGARVEFPEDHTAVIDSRKLDSARAPAEFVRKMRASFLVVGPLLARLGMAEAPHPGGCEIGMRPVNVDVEGFRAMGADVVCEGELYRVECKRLRGTTTYLDYPSHTGTENLMMAACVAKGTTVVKHASMEPEVTDLARFLSRMGARVQGAGSPFLTIEGTDKLHGANYRLMPDRLAAGTYLVAGVISGGSVAVSQVIPEHLDAVTHKLREAGACVDDSEPETLAASWVQPLSAVEIQAIAYPGFPTDLQAAFGALLTQARGTSIIHERVFENRFLYLNELRKMGAEIKVSGQTARIQGAGRLRGAQVHATDIRSGAALVLAALAAEGTTVIDDARHIDRGYDSLVPTLASIGAAIHRE